MYRKGEGEGGSREFVATALMEGRRKFPCSARRGLARVPGRGRGRGVEEALYRYCSKASIWCDLEWSPAYSSGVPK